MFYTAPPSPMPVPVYSQSDCKRGSRDCFPENTRGGAIEEHSMTPSDQDLSAISILVKRLAAG